MHGFGFRSRLGWLLLASVSLVGLSCSGGSLNAVRGKVHYKNQPLAGALVAFHPKGKADLNTVSPTGLTKDDGTFSVMTGDREGAPAGDYVVTVTCTETVAAKPGTISTGPPDTRDKLNGAYSNKENSKLTVTIKPGDNQLDTFDLK
jgi:hypothetical protein